MSEDDEEAALRALTHDAGARFGRGLSHRSITYALGALRQAFAYARRQKWLSENVAQEAHALAESVAATAVPAAPNAGASRRQLDFAITLSTLTRTVRVSSKNFGSSSAPDGCFAAFAAQKFLGSLEKTLTSAGAL